MVAEALDTDSLVLIGVVGIVGIVVAVAIVRGLLELFISWAEDEPAPEATAHAFDPRRPDHCDRCRAEACCREIDARRLRPRPLHLVDREVRR